MAEEFTPITSQDQLDVLIRDRLKRERETVLKKYSDYDDLQKKATESGATIDSLNQALDAANKKISDFDKERAELSSRITAYETSSVKMRIAREMGIPYDLADRLSGDSEDAIREDAKALAPYLKKSGEAPPLRGTEPSVPSDDTMAAYMQLSRNIRGE